MKVKPIQILSLLLICVFLACENENTLEKEISKIEVNFTVERFDEVLSKTNEQDLIKVKEVFPFLFPERIPDSVWINTINSDLQRQMFAEGKNLFKDFKIEKKSIENLFKRLKYYDKMFEVPRVITVADGVDYKNKLVLQADLLIINLMNYLGENHEFYQNTPVYFAERMKPSQIVPEITEKYANRYAYQSQRKTFLDEMIYHGKLLYFKDIMI
ncbi:MAG: gliding motility lipoprotein GldB, partial [Winogradskyella sp.]